MAERHDLNIVITESGDVEIQVQGISGPKCLKTTKVIEEELGEILWRERTSEYYKKETNIEDDVHTKEI